MFAFAAVAARGGLLAVFGRVESIGGGAAPRGSGVAAVAGGGQTFVALGADGRIVGQWGGSIRLPSYVVEHTHSPPVHSVLMTPSVAGTAAVALLADGSLMP
eukprot:gene1562-13805_t